uniref:Uncharacterized protein n=1 Tax=Amphimedon queenslandica TaxID=400682 RepID=A0A1X7SVQ7_AMPQE
MSSLTSSALLFLCIFILFKYSASNVVVKREADRMAMGVCTNTSECSVTCGGGCMIQYCRCEDQAGTALALCGSQPCCSNLNDFRTGNNPLSCIQCNTNPCPGGPTSVNGFIPHSRTLNIVDGVTGMITVTTTSNTAMISITIQVPDPTSYS